MICRYFCYFICRPKVKMVLYYIRIKQFCKVSHLWIVIFKADTCFSGVTEITGSLKLKIKNKIVQNSCKKVKELYLWTYLLASNITGTCVILEIMGLITTNVIILFRQIYLFVCIGFSTFFSFISKFSI